MKGRIPVDLEGKDTLIFRSRPRGGQIGSQLSLMVDLQQTLADHLEDDRPDTGIGVQAVWIERNRFVLHKNAGSFHNFLDFIIMYSSIKAS
jgi:hypothetical protein